MPIKSTGLLASGIRGEFFQKYEALTTYYQELAMRLASTKDQETYKWLGAGPRMREFGSGRVSQGMRTESYNVENAKYEATLEVDRDEISDDQTGQIMLRAGEMGSDAAAHKDKLIGFLINNGHSAGYHAYDGKPFFSTTHESGDSGQQSNNLTLDIDAIMPAGTPNTPDNVDVPTMRQGIQKAAGQLLSLKDDKGEPMAMDWKGLAVLVHPLQALTAVSAMTAAVLGNNSNTLQNFAKVIPYPWLTDQSAIVVCKTDRPLKPFIFQDRESIEFNSLTDDSEGGFIREKYLFGVRARYRLAYGFWQFAVKVDFI